MYYKNRCIVFIKFLLLLGLCFQGVAQAGRLKDFEQDATHKEKSSKKSHHGHHESHDSCIGSFISDLLTGCLTGNSDSEYDDEQTYYYDDYDRPDQPAPPSTTKNEPDIDLKDHTLYAQTENIPAKQNPFYINLDANYMHVNSDLWALDVGLTAAQSQGFGIRARDTFFNEKNPDDNLQFFNLIGFFSLALNSNLDVGLGVGFTTINSDSTNSGGCLAIPIRITPIQGFPLYIESLTAWTSISEKVISDYDFSILIGYKILFLRAGYRFLMTEHEDLNSSYAGVSLRF